MAKKTQFDEIAVRELNLYENSNFDLYTKSKQPIYTNLDKKVKKGTYDSKKAEIAFKHHADKSAKSYNEEFGSKDSQIFSVADRKQLAKELVSEYEEEKGIK